MKALAMTSLALLLSPCLQAAETIYDSDASANRTTHYDNGPLSRISVHTSSNHHLEAMLVRSTVDGDCLSGNLVLESSGQVIAALELTPAQASGDQLFHIATANIPSGFETQPKSLIVDCSVSDQDYRVHHKQPASPTIQLNSNLQGLNWVNPNNNWPGFFQTLNYQGQVFIDNHAVDGSCIIDPLIGHLPTFDVEQNGSREFHSNSFSTEGRAAYTSIFSPYLVRNIICKNSGGTTLLNEEWALSRFNQDDIQGSNVFYYR